MARESVREKNADDEPENPLKYPSMEISCRRDRLSLFEYFIATNMPTKMAISESMRVSKNFPRLSFTVRAIEKRKPFIKE